VLNRHTDKTYGKADVCVCVYVNVFQVNSQIYLPAVLLWKPSQIIPCVSSTWVDGERGPWCWPKCHSSQHSKLYYLCSGSSLWVWYIRADDSGFNFNRNSC